VETGKKRNRHALRGVGCSNWSCNQVLSRARNPPTRDTREARSFKANGLSLRGQSLA